jgi:hypothetical protein
MNKGLLGYPKRAGSGLIAGFWDPDGAPDNTPSSWDDDFEDRSLSLRWTSVNWSGFTTLDYHTSFPGHLYMNGPASGSMHALLQPLPSGDFTAWLRVRIMPETMPWTGILLSTTNTAGTGSQTLIMCHEFSSALQEISVGVYTFTNFGTSPTLLVSNFTARFGAPILRLRRASGTYERAFGYDGRTWFTPQTFTPSGTPIYVGLAIVTAGGTHDAAIDYFRLRESATANTGALRATV